MHRASLRGLPACSKRHNSVPQMHATTGGSQVKLAESLLRGISVVSFSGKTILVTGGGSGIGRATALLLARQGAHVIVTGSNPVSGADTARQISADGGRGAYVQADLTRDAEIDALFAAVERDYGVLDHAFNNAGVGGTPTPILDTAVGMFDEIFAINSRAVWMCMQRELRLMQERRGSSIANNCSVHGTRWVGG